MNSIIIQTMKKLLTLSLTLVVLVTFAEISAAQSCIQPPSGLVAWWTLDETSGTTVTDMSAIIMEQPSRLSLGRLLPQAP